MGLFPKTAQSTTPEPAAPATGPRKTDVRMDDGFHDATVVHVIPGETKTGKVRFGIKFENAAGEVAWGNIVAPDQNSSAKHIEVFYRQMGSLGLGDGFLNDDDTTPETVAEALLGAKTRIRVGSEIYNGNLYEGKVQWIGADKR